MNTLNCKLTSNLPNWVGRVWSPTKGHIPFVIIFSFFHYKSQAISSPISTKQLIKHSENWYRVRLLITLYHFLCIISYTTWRASNGTEDGHWCGPCSGIYAVGKCISTIKLYKCDHQHVALPRLHYREFLNPIFRMLHAAR